MSSFWIRSRRIHTFLRRTDPGTDPDSSIIKHKYLEMISTVLSLLYDFVSLENDVNVISKSGNKQKKIFYVGVLKVTGEKSRIRIH